MQTFILTEHAQKRIIERDIPNPKGLRLKPVGNKLKMKIRNSCLKNGFKNQYRSEYVYFQLRNLIIYVCIIIDVGIYKVLTAFILDN